MIPEVSVDVPRLSPVSGPTLSKLIATWLSHPRLERATLISFAFDERADVPGLADDPPTTVLESLERAAISADVTLVISREAAFAGGRRGDALRATFRRLDTGGIRVLIHQTLHAKIYLFSEQARRCWVVGSTNLTVGGLRNNEEVNLRGFHPDDYAQVEHMATQIVDAAAPYWE